nr:MAG TPA: hypothetical protein [Caudoviricetes sp.]
MFFVHLFPSFLYLYYSVFKLCCQYILLNIF